MDRIRRTITTLFLAVVLQQHLVCSLQFPLSSATVEDAASWAVKVRRDLHKIPELQYDLPLTSARVQRALAEIGVKFKPGYAKHGVVGQIGTGKLPSIALRADMDALPIQEAVEGDFKSTHSGKMHACGHDVHTSMLLGAARLLKQHEANINGTIKLVFQPAEEGGAGALQMIKEGLLDEYPPIQMIYGMHVAPFLPAGDVASKAGVVMAASGFFHITFKGRGGHAAMPDTTIDPVICSSSAIMSIQTIVARNLPATDEGVISVTLVRAGDGAFNIIPNTAIVAGTIRSLTKEGYAFLETRLEAIVKGAAATHGCEADLKMSSFDLDCMARSQDFVKVGAPGACTFPATVNTPAEWGLHKEIAAELIGDANRTYELPSALMAGEDFAYYQEKIPGSFMFLGSGNAQKKTNVNLHNPLFQMDEAQMPLGIAIHANSALKALEELNRPQLRQSRLERFGQSADKAHPNCGMTANVDEV